MTTIPIAISRYVILIMTALFLIAAEAAAAEPAAANATTVAPVSAGDARIWIYRDYLPSESLNMATVSINGAVTGYAQAAGGVFYRDVPPGHYLVTVDSYGRDTNQSANLVLGARQEAYVKIESLRSWSSFGGDTTSIERDTFYARPIPAQLARAEIAHIPYFGGG